MFIVGAALSSVLAYAGYDYYVTIVVAFTAAVIAYQVKACACPPLAPLASYRIRHLCAGGKLTCSRHGAYIKVNQVSSH